MLDVYKRQRIFGIHHYREGVIAQFFYVGAQIMCWTFIIQYGTRYFMSEGMEEKDVYKRQAEGYAFCRLPHTEEEYPAFYRYTETEGGNAFRCPSASAKRV